MKPLDFEVVPVTERAKAGRVAGSLKYDALFAALWRGETVRIQFGEGDGWRAANVIRASWSHKHKGVPIHVVAASDGNGYLAWADVNGAAT